MNNTDVVRKITELKKAEEEFKKVWLHGGQEMLKSSMTYAQYEAYVEEGRCIQTPESHYYRDMSEEHLGNTVIEVENISLDDRIHMTMHQRYSYPVLHNHAYIEIVYVYSGECTHFVEDKEFTMKQGDFCILAPHAMHALSVASDDTIVMNIMVSRQVFDRSFLDLLRGGKVTIKFFEDLFYKRELVSPYVIYPTGNDELIKTLTELMYQEVEEQQYAYRRNLLLLVQSIFIHLIRKYEMYAIVTTSTESAFNNHVVSVLGYLSLNYNRTTLNDTAAFFGYAPNYLGKMLKRYTGKTYTEIILEYQLENAKRMLEENERSITEISQEIGCFDASHFTRKFKKRYGVSPTEYREQFADGKHVN
ncbi:MAG: AraC family transcriptional regulator [Faecalicatena sp.]|uniref:AraC family transcriptional regulator n=1 Tax=Faecalicatena sp. TaxID=2005360 RepID=UPI0025828011|nr:AraC family transcriptional regulator [Faecalicatena sp.]MCI6465689.1 AraC family transcriptional regulator [Faecalicatena sp.]MDY5618036.1 AraC family transcriptional regulator [Lachnospiraceae bacterium]